MRDYTIFCFGNTSLSFLGSIDRGFWCALRAFNVWTYGKCGLHLYFRWKSTCLESIFRKLIKCIIGPLKKVQD